MVEATARCELVVVTIARCTPLLGKIGIGFGDGHVSPSSSLKWEWGAVLGWLPGLVAWGGGLGWWSEMVV